MVRNLAEPDIPNGWKYDLLDTFTKRGSGHTPNKKHSEYWNGGIKWVSLSDSSELDKGYIFETDKNISDIGIKNSSAVLHPQGTVILSRDAGVGKSAVIAEPMAVSQHFIAWCCDNKEVLNSWFLYNWLQVMKPEFERQAVGSTIKTIGLAYFKKLKIAVPPYPEQQKIAKILTTWDKAITITEQLISNSQQQKKALMQQLLTGKKRLAGFSGEWEEKALSALANISMGSSPKSEHYNNQKNGLPLIQGNADIKNRLSAPRVYTSEITKECFVDDILLSVRAPVGEVSRSIHHACIGRGVAAIKAKEGTSQDFLYQWLQYFEPKWARFSQGSTFEAVNSNDIRTLHIDVPLKEEQQKIASILINADKEIDHLKQQLSDLKQEKKALMQQLLTGKRRVKIKAELNGSAFLPFQ